MYKTKCTLQLKNWIFEKTIQGILTLKNDSEQNGFEQKGSEQNGSEQNGFEQTGFKKYCLGWNDSEQNILKLV